MRKLRQKKSRQKCVNYTNPGFSTTNCQNKASLYEKCLYWRQQTDGEAMVQCSLDSFRVLSLNFGGKWKKLAESRMPEMPTFRMYALPRPTLPWKMFSVWLGYSSLFPTYRVTIRRQEGRTWAYLPGASVVSNLVSLSTRFAAPYQLRLNV